MNWWQRWRWLRFWKRWKRTRSHAMGGWHMCGNPVWAELQKAGLFPPEVVSLTITIAVDDVIRVEYECNCPKEVLDVGLELARTHGEFHNVTNLNSRQREYKPGLGPFPHDPVTGKPEGYETFEPIRGTEGERAIVNNADSTEDAQPTEEETNVGRNG